MNKKTLLATAMAAALSTGILSASFAPVYAAETAATTTEQTADASKTQQPDLIKVSEDAARSMYDVSSARIALFNGTPHQAQLFTDAAVTRIEAALKDASQYAIDLKKQDKEQQPEESSQKTANTEVFVPFDASLSVAESFVPDKDKMEHINEANKHMRRGKTREAIEELKLGEIDVSLTTEMLPLQFAKSQIIDAAKLIDEGKYYEANLALKSVADSVIYETYSVDDLPKTQSNS